jgi:two-component system, OmpR family, phosphate regulon sensor histidine kinase PhoR
LKLRLKLFLLALGLIGLSVLIAYGYSSSEAERLAKARIESDLIVRLRLLAHQLEERELSAFDSTDWDPVADALGQAARGRVTIISAGGRVLGDSMVKSAELARLDDHRSRPEVQDALAGEIGRADRHSDTAKRWMFYIASPLRFRGQVVGVVRLSLPTTTIDESLDALRRVLVVAAMLALSVSLVVAVAFVQVLSSRLTGLTQAAKRMAGGDLTVRARLPGAGELSQLGDALDQLARSLSTTLGDLRQERDRIAGILSSMEEGVLFLDEAGKVALVNPALRKMLLLSGDPVGRSLLEVVRHAELKEMVDAAFEGEVDDDEDDGGGPIQGEIRIGGLLPRQLLVRIQRLEGAAIGVVGVFMDVTENRRLENLRREFVANVSHELRTPVTSILSAAETLGGDTAPPPEMSKRFIEIIDRNASRLHALVEDLLDLSRIESRQFSLTLGPLEPGQVMQHIASLFEDRARRRNVTLQVAFPGDLTFVRADRRALEHVLSNLVDNGVKYAGVGKRVVLAARQDDDGVEFSVADDGTGIEPKHLPRLFERFYRVDAGRSRDVGGTGLGLAIVKHLVESMQGTVRVQSEVGRGTTFFIRLPAIQR